MSFSSSDPEAETRLFCRSTGRGIGDEFLPLDELAESVFDVGSLIDNRYLLKEVLGAGGMGKVFLGADQRLDRLVAIKVVKHDYISNESTIEEELQREAKLGANLSHPGIATVFDFGFHEKKSYTVFEFVEGKPLREVLDRRGVIPIDETLRTIGALARALDFAHSKGIVHRDLKPENVSVSQNGEIKILDLGIAHDIYKGSAEPSYYSGTPAYSSPEQAQCKPIDGKSDQYALGLIAFEMLTGERPFRDVDRVRLLNKQISEQPPAPSTARQDLSDDIDAAILRALSKKPADRFATCQEFAAALGFEGFQAANKHVVSVSEDDRVAFFVSHIGEDSLFARRIAEKLEETGFRCWYYERDALPGIYFASQVAAALSRSEAMVLLISRRGLLSIDLSREIEEAYKLSCPILPVLVDMTPEEFETAKPSWRVMLASTPMVECRRLIDVDSTVERIAASASAMGLESRPSDKSDNAIEPKIKDQAWATDAIQIDIADLPHVIFRNDLIDDFLRLKNKYFLAATKGLGKTLLLTYKRFLLGESSSESSQTITMVPEGRPYLDLMDELRQLPGNYDKPLSLLNNTKRFWSAALRISAISHHADLIGENDEKELKKFPATLQDWLRGEKVEPTVVFKELTGLTLSNLNQLINNTENFLAKKMRSIHGPTYFFIDKVDQAMSMLSREAWIHVQAGLIEAAWDMMNSNRHVKIFATIRQEAFANYRSDIKTNLYGATTSLQYSEEDLAEMLDQLAACYEGNRKFNQFVGFNVVKHPKRPAPEDCYQFVRRHSFGRPRDLVLIASEVSAQRKTLTETRFRDIVRQTSATALVNNIFDEVGVLLDCLREEDQRTHLFREINQNILDYHEAVSVCEKFNGLQPGNIAPSDHDSESLFHPFRDLYLAGLLGVIEKDPVIGLSFQRFRQPHHLLSSDRCELPISEYYFLHPSLNGFLKRYQNKSEYLIFQQIALGDGLIWEPRFAHILQIEKFLAECGEPKFEELIHQLIRRTQAIVNSKQTQFLRYEVESSREWTLAKDYEHLEVYPHVMDWLNELLTI